MPFPRKNISKEGSKTKQGVIAFLGGLSLLVLVLAWFLPFREVDAIQANMLEASEIMADALEGLRECRAAAGLDIDRETDPNQTGIIGLEFSPPTTSRGSLESKRTSTSPDFAALLVYLLDEAEVGKGDTIAIGASGSFPGLIIATLSAAKAMGTRPLPIYSLGASQWGANHPKFSWLRMQDCLKDAGRVVYEPIAVSLGGDNDVGEGWGAEIRSSLENEISKRGYRLIKESVLEKNVEIRMQIYQTAAQGSPIKAFVHIGGAWANMGSDSKILELSPGLAVIEKYPPRERRGVLYAMAARGTPVIHLLFIRGLAERYGLAWDPVPLRSPNRGLARRLAVRKNPAFPYIGAIYLLIVFVTLARKGRAKESGS